MQTRRQRRTLFGVLNQVLVIIGFLALGKVQLGAQQFTTLVSFTNVWKYDQSGADFGTEWRTNDFDDSGWSSGQGLLGAEPDTPHVYTQYAPILTPLTVSQAVTTYYFRTTFEFNGSMEGLKLFATNLIDDGCAIYLNGWLAGGVRLPSLFNAATLFSGPATEGQLDVVAVTNLLRPGSNQLAVEVHQAGPISADIMFGMKLVAVNETPLVITNQPQSLNVLAGEPVELNVGVSGGPVTYRWQRDGANLPSTSNTVRIASAQPANAGSYRVICSNSLSVVTSIIARLTVVPDRVGPRPIRAIADNGFGFNAVQVSFSEALIADTFGQVNSARNPANYRLTRLSNGRTIAVRNVLYSTGLGALLILDGENPNWVLRDDYLVTINNVADRALNTIPPDSTLPVAWVYETNVFQDLHVWDFHSSAIFDPGVFDEAWFLPEYVPGPWWGNGWGPFYGVAMPLSTCPGLSLPQTAVGWQPEPMLFRTAFEYPAGWPSEAILKVRTAFDDGMVLYLNGSEIYRGNVPGASGTPIHSGVRSQARADAFVCVTNISLSLTNLRPGPNYLAAAVVQTSVGLDGDIYFSVEMDASVVLAGALPPEPVPALQISQVDSNGFSLRWTGSGYALESSTNLGSGALSYPAGPWTEVPRASNPHLWVNTNGVQHFFRLKK